MAVVCRLLGVGVGTEGLVAALGEALERDGVGGDGVRNQLYRFVSVSERKKRVRCKRDVRA